MALRGDEHTQVRRKHLVGRKQQVVRVPRAHIRQPVRGRVNRIHDDACAGGVRCRRGGGDGRPEPQRVRHGSQRKHAHAAVGQQRCEVIHLQAAAAAAAPHV